MESSQDNECSRSVCSRTWAIIVYIMFFITHYFTKRSYRTIFVCLHCVKINLLYSVYTFNASACLGGPSLTVCDLSLYCSVKQFVFLKVLYK